ncbi:MAG: hypothetical protein IPK79_07535 [Vampirovibrionales bacterium]|nr:hypothetical protein [Vampirovibrionales bacterium]
MTLANTLVAAPDAPDSFGRRFFQQALTHRGLAHAYLLLASRMEPLYEMALILAKILNCSQRPAPDAACGQCLNCRWIDDNAHPALITLSPLTHLDEASIKKVAKTGKALTQIAADQTSNLLAELSRTSPYCRVVIVVHAESFPGAAPAHAPPSPSQWRAHQGVAPKRLALRPLTTTVLNDASANRMLKTLEEPPENTLFLFLSDSPAGVLETIASRCQVLPFALTPADDEALETTPDDARRAQAWLSACQSHGDPLDCADAFETDLVGEGGLSATQALSLCQRVLRQQWDLNPGAASAAAQQADFMRYRRAQQAIEDAQRLLEAKTNAAQTLVGLTRRLCQ